MKNKSASKIQMPGIEELLKATKIDPENADGQVVELPIIKLKAYHDHPFKVNDDEKMEELKDSIADFGVLTPVLVRKMPEEDMYEIISGHRRSHAAQAVGLETIPALILRLNDDEADIAMVNANLQREYMLPSEKAKAYRKKYNAMKHQGQSGGRSLKKMEEDIGESQMTIHRYLRLNELTDELLELADKGQLGLMQGVDLSFLSKEDQESVFEEMSERKMLITKRQSELLKKYSDQGKLTPFMIRYVLSGVSKHKDAPVKLKRNRLQEFFEDGESDQEIEEIIIRLLTEWKKSKEVTE